MRRTNEKGITLISLIVTIVILIILLGVIEMVMPEDVFKKAQETEKHTVEAVTDSQKYIDGIKSDVPEIKNDIITPES